MSLAQFQFLSILQHELRKDPKASNKRLAKMLQASPRRVSRWRAHLRAVSGNLDSCIASVLTRDPKLPSTAVKRRRQNVLRLARQITTRGDFRSPKFPSTRSIASVVRVSPATVWRDLRAVGMKCRVRPKVPKLSAKGDAKRFRFVKCWKDFDPRRMAFSDESFPSSNQGGMCRTQWIAAREEALPLESQRWPFRVMVWGMIWVGGRHLTVMKVRRTLPKKRRPGRPQKRKGSKKKNVKKEEANITAVRYLNECIRPVLRHLKKNNLHLVQDGAKAHQAKMVKDFFHAKGVPLVEPWPAHTPQLNMIEMVWGQLQKRVAQRFPQSQDELEKFVVEEWNQIPQSHIDATIMSFTKRANRIFARKGRV